MAGTSCQGNCHDDGILFKEHQIRPIRGQMRKGDRGKEIKKCGTCQIRILDFKGRTCPCCNTRLRKSTRYKQQHLVHRLEDLENNIQIPRMIPQPNGMCSEILQVVGI